MVQPFHPPQAPRTYVGASPGASVALPSRFWHRPAVIDLLAAVGVALPLFAVWFLVFAGGNFLTTCHSLRFRIHLPGEERLPFVPVAVLVYQSLVGLFVMVPFVLRVKQIRRLAATLLAVILVAGVGFLLVPSDLAFPPIGDTGAWEKTVRVSKELALPHSLVPSLHVAMSVCCVAVYAPRAGRWGSVTLWGWASAIALSTLLFHQHHLIDVLTGWALGRVGVYLIYERSYPPGGKRCPPRHRNPNA
jgi:membrane-associated phospholipid phosphatase